MKNRVTYEIDQGVADVRLVRTDKSNALDGAMFDALIDCGTQLKNTAGLRAVVISGEGSGFCAGIDMDVLKEMEGGAIAGAADIVTRTHGVCNRFQYAAWIWREMPVPVIAAVHGFALGGGFQLALGADMRFVAPDAKMALMEVKWGLVPDMGATHLMCHLVREDLVRDLGFTGRVFNGTQAHEYGLATRLSNAPHTEALQAARDIADKSPSAMRALKRLFNGAYDQPARDRLTQETIEQQKLVGGPDQVETVESRRMRRAPVFADAREG
ncbi:crotonase/enoyl-CoA hydratase family protein [Thalassovita taeanensis]|uniref:Enoyl-CoA hydratase/carnithine racemase n=1 Tax=Thalassovita taeanensis TaxID=657014 RepID=A0A1H9EET9_9RHOB|nr:crotonase/enoyl-CoA hydratase family protein [Thalassovita taeanensis]SEQ23518.1 Enoyl-CoA hydratase/carnithine racemase [Thalassovita taeanensis]